MNKLGIRNKVIFAGTVTNVYDYLQAMDVFVFPPLYEGLGIALIEAQASGLPCLISKNIPSECEVTDLIFRESLKANPKQ